MEEMAVKLKTDITFESTEVTTCYLSKESFMQRRGNETITESANASIGNPSNDSLLQSRERETIAETANASIDSHSLEPRMQSRESETITESANSSIHSHSLDSLMQSRGSEIITGFANASIGNSSNDSLMQSRGNETITESANDSIDSHSLECLMQSRGSEAITESANANIDSHSLEPCMQSSGSETIAESANASIDSHNLVSLMQSRGSETITESANASIGNPSNDSLMQSRENETITESANASIGNPSNDSLLQSRESEAITESANASIDSHSLESLMQSRGSENITESGNATIGHPSNDFLMQSRGNEIIAESANASIDSHSLESLMQSLGRETITESANASIVAGREHECIICNWIFLKENINADHIKDDLISTELIDSKDCDGGEYHDKSRIRKIDHLLTCVVRNIRSPRDLEKFINIFEKDHKFIADKLKLPIEVPDWSKGAKNVEKCRHRLATNRKLIEKELKKPQKLFDDFLENFVFDIGDHEYLCKLTGGRKKMAECFMNKVLTSVEKGSYDLLLHILKTEMNNVYQRIVVGLDKTPDQSVPKNTVFITLTSGKLYESNEDNTPRTDVSEDCTFTITIKCDARGEHQIKENAMRMVAVIVREFGAIPTHVTDGSVVIHLKSVDGDIISRLTDSIRRGQFVRLIKELLSCHEANSSIPAGHWSVDFIIELDNSSSKMKSPATPLKLVVKTGDHRLQLLHANRAFLQEEIDPLTLLEAFSKRGFDHFKEANIEIIPERKLRTDKFLDILEKKSDQLMEVFKEILEDQKMNFVLKRLKLYQKMQFIDAALLKKNILKHIESIVDEVDLEDIKDEIISRYGLHGDVVDELYSQYPEGSEGRIVAMIVDILGQGDSAVCMFIDILFDSGIDSSLLEELSDIEQVRGDMDCVGDNAFEIIREVPKRGLIFQCEVEVTVEEVKDTKSLAQASPVELHLLIDEQREDTMSWFNARLVDTMSWFKARLVDTITLSQARPVDKMSWPQTSPVDLHLLIEKQRKDLHLLIEKQRKDKMSWPQASPVDKMSWPQASPVDLHLLIEKQRKELHLLIEKQRKDTKSWRQASPVDLHLLVEKEAEELHLLIEKQRKDTITLVQASPVGRSKSSYQRIKTT